MLHRLTVALFCLFVASCTTAWRVEEKKLPVTALSQFIGEYAPGSAPEPAGGSASLANFLWPSSKNYHEVQRVRFTVPQAGVLRCEGVFPGGRRSLIRDLIPGKNAALKDGVLHWDMESARTEAGVEPAWLTAAVSTDRKEFLLLENRDLCMRLHSGAYGVIMLIPVANKEVSEHRYERLK